MSSTPITESPRRRTRTAGSRTATMPMSSRGSPPRTSMPRSMLDVPARAEWHQRLVALMELPVSQHATLRGDHLFCYERPAGAEQFVLVRRAAGDPRRLPSCCSIRRSSSVDSRGRSTGTSQRTTDRSSPSASARAGPSTPCSTSSPAPTGPRQAATVIAFRTRGPLCGLGTGRLGFLLHPLSSGR